MGHLDGWPDLQATDDDLVARSSLQGVFAFDLEGTLWQIPEKSFVKLLNTLAVVHDEPTSRNPICITSPKTRFSNNRFKHG